MATLQDIFRGNYSLRFADFLIHLTIGKCTEFSFQLEKTSVSPDLFTVNGFVISNQKKYNFINSYGKRPYDRFTFYRLELYNSSDEEYITIENNKSFIAVYSPDLHFHLTVKNQGRIVYREYRNDHVRGGSFYITERYYLFEKAGYLLHGRSSAIEDQDHIYTSKTYYYRGKMVLRDAFESDQLSNTIIFNEKYMEKINKWLNKSSISQN